MIRGEVSVAELIKTKKNFGGPEQSGVQ
jgi:hypothetical protein